MGYALELWLQVSVLAALPTSLIVALSRRRVAWRYWEALAFVLPFWSWIAIDAIFHLPKSLSNIGELVMVAFLIPAAALVRVALARRSPELPVAVVAQVLLVGIMIAQYFTTPLLPE